MMRAPKPARGGGRLWRVYVSDAGRGGHSRNQLADDGQEVPDLGKRSIKEPTSPPDFHPDRSGHCWPQSQQAE
ncbi:hypothetical protein EVAR_22407_1 [Eumeta japonica]|uniref:Uncharacterized protein n=1 Tax=Eumeta variegata TaxID=151549 RepID=A0A4C2A1F7_EUMVA|nr:hypothetical protein EVAR_22407_1 [Eumeta japonica]